MKVIGNFEYEFPGIDLEVIQWSKEKISVEDMQGIDIGLYPLVEDDFVLGKNRFKSHSIYGVWYSNSSTNYGTTPILIEHMENGLLVASEDEWFDALKTLIQDTKLRRKLGKNARETAQKKFSVNAIAPHYVNILDSL